MWVHNGCFYVFRDWWGTPKPLISSWKMLELIFDANLIVYQTNLIIFLLEMPYDGHKHQISGTKPIWNPFSGTHHIRLLVAVRCGNFRGKVRGRHHAVWDKARSPQQVLWMASFWAENSRFLMFFGEEKLQFYNMLEYIIFKCYVQR